MKTKNGAPKFNYTESILDRLKEIPHCVAATIKLPPLLLKCNMRFIDFLSFFKENLEPKREKKEAVVSYTLFAFTQFYKIFQQYIESN